MTTSSFPPTPRILLSSTGRSWNRLEASFQHISRGLSHAPAAEMHRLGLHFGPPVRANCSCAGIRMRRMQKSGDIDIVPAGAEGFWEDDSDCQILQLGLHPSLLQEVAQELGRDLGKTALQPRLQVRDARIEGIAWAIKADLESDTPSDPLYIDLLANALAIRLIEPGPTSRLRPRKR
jgi:AraC family transcriptional regulator